MRPNPTTADAKEHECMTCGARTESPEARVCADCGGELRSLGRARDL